MLAVFGSGLGALEGNIVCACVCLPRGCEFSFEHAVEIDIKMDLRLVKGWRRRRSWSFKVLAISWDWQRRKFSQLKLRYVCRRGQEFETGFKPFTVSR